MKYCSHCGHLNQDEAMFCGGCGKLLSINKGNDNQRTHSNSGNGGGSWIDSLNDYVGNLANRFSLSFTIGVQTLTEIMPLFVLKATPMH